MCKDRPSVGFYVRVHSQLAATPALAGCPANRTYRSVSAMLQRTAAPAYWSVLASLRAFVSEMPISESVPPVPFLTTSAGCSAYVLQACCILLPTMGFALAGASPFEAFPFVTAHPCHHFRCPLDVSGVASDGSTEVFHILFDAPRPQGFYP